MATLKHIASKNADYGAAEQYLTFEHDEFSGKPILDENGRLVPSEDYRISSLAQEMEATQKRITELSSIFKRLYEDSVTGRISDERFMELSADYEQEQAALKARLAEFRDAYGRPRRTWRSLWISSTGISASRN